ncbi:MAG TPA: phosphatidylcholine synthase, partial [Pseudolabrys sp.]|nr:phosphatidylcholine synthase [Pseudolabrys sp.]
MSRFQRARAFAIHVFTATGAGLAFLALVLAAGGHWAAMFFTLGLSLVVDAIDGPLARAFDIGAVLPRWNGDTLDLVIDYATYVFVPAYAIAGSGLLPPSVALLSGVIVCMTGALYFADRRMKTDDNYFRGFPGLWNLAAFYLYILEPPPWAAAGGVLVLAILSFIPVKFLHPFRVRHWRPLNVALLAVWG